MNIFLIIKGCFIIILFYLSVTAVTAQNEGENIFKQKCTACHTIGKGKLVGPDLSGVSSRREDGWLKRQIKTPDVMIAEKDPIVMKLLEESNNVPMAPLGLSDNEVEAVIVFLKSTEQQKIVVTGLPSEYMPTILISIVVLLGLTFIGLRVGTKKVDVR